MRKIFTFQKVSLVAVSLLAAACADTSSKTVALQCGSQQIEVTFSFREGVARPMEMRFPLANGTPAVATFSGESDAPTINWPMADEVFLGSTRPRKLTYFQGAQVASLPKTSLLFDDGRACFETR